MQEKSEKPDQMPETIGRYKVVEGVGFGAMGAVYKAFDPLIKRTLAIKTIRLDIPRQSPQYRSFIERFYHEARISGTLSHPNIVTLFDIGEENGIPYLAMEFVDGRNVAELIESGYRFKPEKVIGLASQIGSAIDYAHGKGVIHRDIKPSNLILYEEDKVKVTDFGIAKLADAEMTQSGTLLGTPSYMSPEQAMGDRLDGRSDIFSLGVCCFEMLSGEQPFPGANVTSILYKLVHVPPVEPANLEMNGLVPQKWHEVFGKVLAKQPNDRYQTAIAFVQDLEYCLGSWFGAIGGGEETIALAVTAVAAEPAAPVPEVVSEETETTVVLAPAPAVDAGLGSAGPALSADDPLPATVALKLSPAHAPDAPEDPTNAMPQPAAQAAPDDTSTVILKSPPAGRAGPPPEESPDTVILEVPLPAEPTRKPGAGARRPKPAVPKPAGIPTLPEPTLQLPARPTIRMKGPDADATPTVRVASGGSEPRPLPSAPRPARPPAPPAVEESPGAAGAQPPPTVVMAPLPTAPWATPPEVTEPLAAPAPRRSFRPGLPLGLVLGGTAALVALTLASGIYLWRARNQSTSLPAASPPPPATLASAAPDPTPVTPPPAMNGVLHVETKPAGAVVILNGQTKGTTPLEIGGLPSGVYELKLDLKGYEPRTQTVTLNEASPRADLGTIPLKVTTAPVATVDILSTPFGASVTLDGVGAGLTPLLQLRLKAGAHQVVMNKEGFEPWAQTLTVEAGKRASLDAQLKERASAPVPTPSAEAVDVSRIYNNVSGEVTTLARKASGSSPSYPESAPRLRSGEAISVSVSFVVTEEGEVVDAKVTESGGKIVDEAVLAAVKEWRYTPAVKQGVKVRVRLSMKQTFRAG